MFLRGQDIAHAIQTFQSGNHAYTKKIATIPGPTTLPLLNHAIALNAIGTECSAYNFQKGPSHLIIELKQKRLPPFCGGPIINTKATDSSCLRHHLPETGPVHHVHDDGLYLMMVVLQCGLPPSNLLQKLASNTHQTVLRQIGCIKHLSL